MKSVTKMALVVGLIAGLSACTSSKDEPVSSKGPTLLDEKIEGSSGIKFEGAVSPVYDGTGRAGNNDCTANVLSDLSAAKAFLAKNEAKINTRLAAEKLIITSAKDAKAAGLARQADLEKFLQPVTETCENFAQKYGSFICSVRSGSINGDVVRLERSLEVSDSCDIIKAKYVEIMPAKAKITAAE